MDTFEKQSENLAVQDKYIEDTMSQATSLTTPANQVDDLIGQVAAEYGLQISEQLSGATPSSMLLDYLILVFCWLFGLDVLGEKNKSKEDDLMSRLAKLNA